jgi:hypothetical protein
MQATTPAMVSGWLESGNDLLAPVPQPQGPIYLLVCFLLLSIRRRANFRGQYLLDSAESPLNGKSIKQLRRDEQRTGCSPLPIAWFVEPWRTWGEAGPLVNAAATFGN